MDYALTYFGKQLMELQLSDVEFFFTGERIESDQIEFKSFHSKTSVEQQLPNIIRSITAFLNSSGGLLIWGAPKGVEINGKKEKAFVGDLTMLPLSIEKDWLISKIADKIIPLPRIIRVKLISGPNGQVVVFEVEESPYAPHQTSDMYYMRIDGQNKPAPHHYIEALFKKINFPRIEAYIKCGSLINAPARTCIIEVEFLFYNFSPFINEESLLYTITIKGGYFKRGVPELSYASGLNLNYNEQARTAHNESHTIAVRYGQPSPTREPLIFTEDELIANGDVALITVSFSGRIAPMRVCQYRLKFKRIDNQHNAQEVFCSIDFENELIADRNQAMGLVEEDLLNQMGVIR